ncbi:MAG TPA: conjugal transfer protein MobB [Niabella sp.]|uniref:conjugal transfer protein MobB n=1 Tax=Agriterribacter sp. TaxID=2821509 RepID=UPI002BA83706|nr:conjugal transfer protein MobB [Agriterribacter sp.]HRO46771.1 conjugal transfer protein MobB [Agriterribacter sp.]HUN03253.1 conjugal transfer protein MobB [Niabella sp.]
MIAKIGRGRSIYGALSYNQIKVNKENGEILLLHKMLETPDGSYSVNQLLRSFEPYLLANRNTEKPVVHISLNPDPNDKVSDEKYKLMAMQYMQEMGYGDQPFVVFKHTDTSRTHIHIVSVCVDEEGKKISDSFERKRSMNVCRSLEQQHNLIAATEKTRENDNRIFQPVNYKTGDIKSQMAAVVRYLPKYYQFQTLGAYNALLSLFNITAEEVKGELNGQPKHGLVYIALNEQGEKASNPFKSSLFGNSAGIVWLQKHFENAKEQMKVAPVKATLKNSIEMAIHMTTNEADFKKQLIEQGINTVIRRSNEGRIFGMTFIDHESHTVWNGSHLDKSLSANVFNERWQQEIVENDKNGLSNNIACTNVPNKVKDNDPSEDVHELFDFLYKEQPSSSNVEYGLIESLGGLLPQAHSEDYEELAFENRMKKGKRKTNKKTQR